jgi:putative ABC transport system permease protein
MFKAMLRGLLTHKLRLLLSALAVVLGTMFMSGAFIGGDTIANGFTALFSTVNADLDVQVTAKSNVPGDQQGVAPTAFINAATVAKTTTIDGVRKAVSQVRSDGALVVGKDGKIVGSNGPPRFGIGWVNDPDALTQLRSGHQPTTPGQIAIDAGLVKTTGFAIGNTVDVITPQAGRQSYSLVGIFGYRGGRDNLGGETTVAFTIPEAQKVMIGAPGEFTSIDLTGDAGVSPQTLKSRVTAALGAGFVVKTGAQTAADQASQTSGLVNAIKIGLSAFAVIGLFTAAFLIFNTFSMLVAQRTRELALYRAFGASRGQVNRAVLAEAVLLGLAASIVGLLLGIFIGWALNRLLQAFAKSNLPGDAVVIRPYVVWLTLLVGTAFTVVAALFPALRASRVPPIAAMREAATPDRPLGRLSVGGAIVLAAGVALLAVKLTNVVTSQLGLFLGVGALLTFLGVAMLAPAVSRPVTGTLGKLFGPSVTAKLGTRNTGRNPRRTAVTAAALMIGVALATGAGVFASSAKAGISASLTNDVHAQLLVGPVRGGGGPAGQVGYDPALTARMAAIPNVTHVLSLQRDRVRLGGKDTNVAAGDLPAAVAIFTLTAKSGTLGTLSSGQVVIDENLAKTNHWSVGQTLAMQTARGGTIGERITGIYRKSTVINGPFVSTADATGFRTPLASQGFVQVTPDSAVPAVHTALDALFKSNPEVTVSDRSDLIDQTSSALNVVLTIINVLLGLTIFVAVLGVINTLLLSVYERTREMGLIRAIGMSRGQIARMITVESILISVFGALLGIVVGVALGIAIVAALHSTGFVALTIPWSYLVVTLFAAVVAGVLAAILPAIRAGRLNVLEAIAYE